MAISIAGFNVLFGLASMSASIAAVFGTAGLSIMISSFGLLTGLADFGIGTTSLITKFVGYPQCDGSSPPIKSVNVTEVLLSTNKDFRDRLLNACLKFRNNSTSNAQMQASWQPSSVHPTSKTGPKVFVSVPTYCRGFLPGRAVQSFVPFAVHPTRFLMLLVSITWLWTSLVSCCD